MYNMVLCIVPMAELPHYALSWTAAANHHEERILSEERAVADAILERIRRDGPLATTDFKEHARSIDWWWAPTRVSRAVLEALFVVGRVGIARRDGNRRFYELIERLVPPDLLASREAPEVARRHKLLSRFRSSGLAAATGPSVVIWGAGSTEERRRAIAERVAGRTRDVTASLTNHDLVIAAEGGPVRGRLRDLLDLPTLVVHGTEDPRFPPGHGRALAAAIPGARFVELEGVGHELPPPPAWDLFVDAVVEVTATA
jgi:pimeloyl-ACP methyl ester carboxylesterase